MLYLTQTGVEKSPMSILESEVSKTRPRNTILIHAYVTCDASHGLTTETGINKKRNK